MDTFTPLLALAAFVFALVELGNAFDGRDYRVAYKRLAALLIGFGAAWLASSSTFAAEIPLGTNRSFADLSIADCLLISPIVAGLAMVSKDALTAWRTPSTIVAGPTVNTGPMPADEPVFQAAAPEPETPANDPPPIISTPTPTNFSTGVGYTPAGSTET